LTQLYVEDLLNSTQECVTVDAQIHSGFVDVRTHAGKLIFRFDVERYLIEWREGKNTELIDLKPLLAE
jgi:hypothetical protein